MVQGLGRQPGRPRSRPARLTGPRSNRDSRHQHGTANHTRSPSARRGKRALRPRPPLTVPMPAKHHDPASSRAAARPPTVALLVSDIETHESSQDRQSPRNTKAVMRRSDCRVAERLSQAVELEGSRDSSEATTPTTTTDALAVPCKAVTPARPRLAAGPARSRKSEADARTRARGVEGLRCSCRRS